MHHWENNPLSCDIGLARQLEHKRKKGLDTIFIISAIAGIILKSQDVYFFQ